MKILFKGVNITNIYVKGTVNYNIHVLLFLVIWYNSLFRHSGTYWLINKWMFLNLIHDVSYFEMWLIQQLGACSQCIFWLFSQYSKIIIIRLLIHFNDRFHLEIFIHKYNNIYIYLITIWYPNNLVNDGFQWQSLLHIVCRFFTIFLIRCFVCVIMMNNDV